VLDLGLVEQIGFLDRFAYRRIEDFSSIRVCTVSSTQICYANRRFLSVALAAFEPTS